MTNIEEHTTVLTKLAQSIVATMTSQFFKGMEEITSAVGNVVNGNGSPFSWDFFNDALEKMQIEFDEEGEPKLPTLVTHPDLLDQLRNIKPTPSQKERTDSIITGKRAEFYAQKRTRRLSG